jgi:hypothetical protein
MCKRVPTWKDENNRDSVRKMADGEKETTTDIRNPQQDES